MKKISAAIISIFALALAFLPLTVADKAAFADGETALEVGDYIYAAPSDLTHNSVAGTSTVEVFDTITGDTYFYLPESYFLEITSVNARMRTYGVKYAGLEKSLSVSYDNASAAPEGYAEPDSALAPTVALTVKQGETVLMKNTANADVDMTAASFKYYGENGTSVYIKAVLGDVTVYGAVPKAFFNAYTVPYHPITQAAREGMLSQTPDESVDGGNEGNTSVALRVVLIIGIIIPAVLIALLLFKPNRETSGYDKRAMRSGKKTSGTDYDRDRAYDERDYDRDRRDVDRRDYDRDYDRRDYDRRGYDGRDYDGRREDRR